MMHNVSAPNRLPAMRGALIADSWLWPNGFNLADWMSVVGFPLGVVGFVLAWFQLARTKTAAEETKAAIANTEKHLAENQLLIAIPQLQLVARSFQWAVDRNDHAAARTHLDEWREAAGRVNALARRKRGWPDLVERITEAIPYVLAAREALEDETRYAQELTVHVCERIRIVGDRANDVVTEKMAFVGELADG
jgi:hypothetical protein